nr:prostatic spermine-binding protein-like [Setaria viridis]
MARAVHEQPHSENQGSNSKDNVDKPGSSDEESHEESSDTKGLWSPKLPQVVSDDDEDKDSVAVSSDSERGSSTDEFYGIKSDKDISEGVDNYNDNGEDDDSNDSEDDDSDDGEDNDSDDSGPPSKHRHVDGSSENGGAPGYDDVV